jgi:hypothetical protein
MKDELKLKYNEMKKYQMNEIENYSLTFSVASPT